MKLFLLLLALGIAFLMALAMTPRLVQSQTDPLCVVADGIAADKGEKPMVALACDDEGMTYRFVSGAFYERFLEAKEWLVLRKSEIR